MSFVACVPQHVVLQALVPLSHRFMCFQLSNTGVVANFFLLTPHLCICVAVTLAVLPEVTCNNRILTGSSVFQLPLSLLSALACSPRRSASSTRHSRFKFIHEWRKRSAHRTDTAKTIKIIVGWGWGQSGFTSSPAV